MYIYQTQYSDNISSSQEHINIGEKSIIEKKYHKKRTKKENTIKFHSGDIIQTNFSDQNTTKKEKKKRLST